MGKLSDAFRGVSLPPVKQQQLLALDREFADLKAQVQALAAVNLKLQAEVNSAKRAIEKLKKASEPAEDSLDEITEKILIKIANTEISEGGVIKSMGLTTANGERHLDVLRGKRYIIQSQAASGGIIYRATAKGRAYLARNNKV